MSDAFRAAAVANTLRACTDDILPLPFQCAQKKSICHKVLKHRPSEDRHERKKRPLQDKSPLLPQHDHSHQHHLRTCRPIHRTPAQGRRRQRRACTRRIRKHERTGLQTEPHGSSKKISKDIHRQP